MNRPPRIRAIHGLSKADALKKLDELEQRAQANLSRAGGAASRRASQFILQRLQNARSYLVAEPEQPPAKPPLKHWELAMQAK